MKKLICSVISIGLLALAIGGMGTVYAEEAKGMLGADVRIWDLKRASLHFFDDYDWMDRHNDRMGVRVMFKIGESYEERELAKQSAYMAEVVAAAMDKSRRNDAEIGELKFALKKMQNEGLLSTRRGR